VGEAETFLERYKALRGSLALVILAISITGVFAMSETFAGGAERLIATNKVLEDYEFFLGLIVIPVVGGLVELYGTAGSARANRMELVMATTAGATIQMILLMVPALVLVGSAMGRPLVLVFKPIEIIIFGAATFTFMLLSRDGESSILEGVQLVALWTLLAITALFLPPA
jgi:Ca2+:H+ antiporter